MVAYVGSGEREAASIGTSWATVHSCACAQSSELDKMHQLLCQMSAGQDQEQQQQCQSVQQRNSKQKKSIK